jgi:hypothetical protein
MAVLRTFARGALFALLTLAAAALAAPASAQHESPVVFELDTHSLSGPAEATGPVLAAGLQYRVIVEGTFSAWSAGQWRNGACKGLVEPEPMQTSPGVQNGPVGFDPAFLFAAPQGASACSNPSMVLPFGRTNVLISLDAGTSFEPVEPTNLGDEPDPEHRYVYELTGQGLAVVLRLNDNSPSDNYGMLQVSVEPLLHDGDGQGHNRCFVASEGAREMLSELLDTSPTNQVNAREHLATAMTAIENCGTGSGRPNGAGGQPQATPPGRAPVVSPLATEQRSLSDWA